MEGGLDRATSGLVWRLRHAAAAAALTQTSRDRDRRAQTQFEAWLSMQRCAESGLVPADEDERRVEVVPVEVNRFGGFF